MNIGDSDSRASVLTARCDPNRHLLFEVFEEAGRYFLEAKRAAVGPLRMQWTPIRHELVRGAMRRYGCACGRSQLVSDDLILDDIGRGETSWFIRGDRLRLKGRSAMGE